MNASTHVGRIGGLAVALGVGAAVWSSCAVASADSTSSDSGGKSASRSATASAGPSASGRAAKRAQARLSRQKDSAPGGAATSPDADPSPGSAAADSNGTPAAVTPDIDPAPKHAAPERRDSAAPSVLSKRTPQVLKLKPSAAAPLAAKGSLDPTPATEVAAARLSAAGVLPALAAALKLPSTGTAAAPSAPSSPSSATVLPRLAALPTAHSLRAQPVITLPKGILPPGAMGLVITALAQVALISLSGNIPPRSVTTATPTLTLNGFNLVPASPQKVTSIYGGWTYLPGGPSQVQGEQQFNVVNPITDANVGKFDALVTRAPGYFYTAMLVTGNDGINVGTGAGKVPPVGSMISNFKIGSFGFGYSSMPTASGKNVVSFKLLTPIGDFPLFMPFDAAKGIADHTVDNQPVNIGDGYTIAPARPNAENITGISGILPFFSGVQGNQTFNIYNASGEKVGSFDGLFTSTADIVGTHTQAILVTGNTGDNIGTAPGQVPAVGSVYNVIYIGSDNNYVLYSSHPSPTGDVVSLTQTNPFGVVRSGTTLLDASAPLPTDPMLLPGGRTIVSTSALIPSGINGLPPREVQYQGYQQFDVRDSSGATVGSFDADVSIQRDLFGVQSRGVVVTKVTGGTAGTAPGDVPPVGSAFNYVQFGIPGFGTAQSVMPSDKGDVIGLDLVTPLGNIPVYRYTNPVKDTADVSFYNPFTSVM